MSEPPFPIIREGDAPPPECRPQDPHLDGRDLKFETLEHGGAEADTMPNAIRVTDPQGRSAVYVFKEIEMETTSTMPTESEPRLADAEQVKHTPGTWNVEHYTQGRGGWDITVPCTGLDDAYFGIADVRNEADARLIAAAPDMLAALQDILSNAFEAELEPSYSVPQSVIEKARAAVARAEGRAPTPPVD